MTEKEAKYRARYRNIGKHLFRDGPMPINLASHPVLCSVQRNPWLRENVEVRHGWGLNHGGGHVEIPTDEYGNPKPYEGFWEARCRGCVI